MAETIEKQLDGLAKTCDSLRPGTGSTIRLLCQAFYEKGLSSRGDAGTPDLQRPINDIRTALSKLDSQRARNPGLPEVYTTISANAWYAIREIEAALAHREAPPLQKIIDLIENEPLGYRTEDEHAKLENFADRCIAKILQLPVADREPPPQPCPCKIAPSGYVYRLHLPNCPNAVADWEASQDTQRLTEMQVALGKLKDAESAWQAEREALRDIQAHAEDASRWIFTEKYNNAAIEIQNILKLSEPLPPSTPKENEK